MSLPDLVKRRAIILGVLLGASYGLLARFVIRVNTWSGTSFTVMTVGFLFLVPVAMGYLTIAAIDRPTWRERIFAPWGTVPLRRAGGGAVRMGGRDLRDHGAMRRLQSFGHSW